MFEKNLDENLKTQKKKNTIKNKKTGSEPERTRRVREHKLGVEGKAAKVGRVAPTPV